MSKGFIPIRRTLFDHFLFKEKRVFSRFEAWLDLIQLASFKESSDIIGGKLVTKDRGEIVASVRYLSLRWSWSIHKVCDYLELLRSQDMVVVDKENGISKITLLNFEKHNTLKLPDENEDEEQKRNSKRDAENGTDSGLPNNKGTPKGTKKGQAGDSDGTNIKKVNKLNKENSAPALDLKIREKAFYETIVPFKNLYSKEILRQFFNYWSEPTRSKKKMKFELQTTWDVARRLSTWSKNEDQFNNGKKDTTQDAAIGRKLLEEKGQRILNA